MWPFKPRRYLEFDDEAWQIATWGWLLRHLGGLADLRQGALITPTRDFFPPTDATGHARAEHVFAAVKRHAGMSEWHCRLIAQPDRPEARVGEFWALQGVRGRNPAGTFGAEGNEVVITYDPALLSDPVGLVATLAHELAHYLLVSMGTPPGGPEMEEFATDLTTAYLGFGLFGAASAFRFAQFQNVISQGWTTSRQGYLSQREWLFGLAVFLELREEPADPLKSHLAPHLFSDLRKAVRYLRSNPALLDELRA